MYASVDMPIGPLEYNNTIFLYLLSTELTEMDSQKEEVFKLEQELADAEHKLRLESGKGKGISP